MFYIKPTVGMDGRASFIFRFSSRREFESFIWILENPADDIPKQCRDALCRFIETAETRCAADLKEDGSSCFFTVSPEETSELATCMFLLIHELKLSKTKTLNKEMQKHNETLSEYGSALDQISELSQKLTSARSFVKDGSVDEIGRAHV